MGGSVQIAYITISYLRERYSEEINADFHGKEQTMSRYIEYHDICSAIDNQQDGTGMTYEALAHAMVEIQLAPSIDIVRCKECKHSKPTKYANGNLHCSWHYRSNMPDDFCSYGQKGDENVETD